MYTRFFGLARRPFVLSPDPEFLFFSRGHDLALTHLEYGLMHNVGFVALTGDVGAGKTTLLKYLFERVSHTIHMALILNTHLDSQALLETLVMEFELQPESNRRTDLVHGLFDHFLAQYSLGNRCVVVVDEAQNLPLESFEELRMLSNLETGSDFLVQIVLVGQPQLRDRLSHPSLAQLKQRISVHYHLSPLHKDEVGSYIEHRLRVSGYRRGDSLFEEDAVMHVAELSGGIPRIVNSICDAALTYAFADEASKVSREIIEKVASDNDLLFSQAKDDHAGAVSPWSPVDHKPLADSGLQSLVASVCERVQSLEMRVRDLESNENSRTVKILQELLAEEKERSVHYARKVALISAKHSELLSKLRQIKRDRDQGGWK